MASVDSKAGVEMTGVGASASTSTSTSTPPPPSSSTSAPAEKKQREVLFHMDPAINPDYFLQPRPGQSGASAQVQQPGAGLQPSKTPRPPQPTPIFQHIGLFLTLASLVLFILAASTDELATQQKVAFQVTESETSSWVVAAMKQGMWKLCLNDITVDGVALSSPTGAVCARISSDRYCSVNIVHPSTGTELINKEMDQCAPINGIRASILLAIFGSAVAFFAQRSHTWSSNPRSQRLGITMGIFGAFWGMISMAVAANHFGADSPTRPLAMNEYGSSFWFIVIGWPLQFIAALVFSMRRPHTFDEQKKFAGYTGATITFIVWLFYLVSIASRELTYTTTVEVGNNYVGASGSPIVYYNRQTQGYWSICNYYGNSTTASEDQTCQDIDSSCSTSTDSTSYGSCNTLRTIRTWVLIATIISFATGILQIYSVRKTQALIEEAKKNQTPMVSKSDAVKWAILFALITPALGFMATSLQVDFYVQSAGNWGFSFWLCLLAWVLGLVSLVVFAWDYHDQHVRKVLTSLLLTFLGGVGLITAISMPHWVYITSLPLFNDPFYAHASFTGRPLQYGLWRLCVAGNDCKVIQSDDTCQVGDGYPSLYPCDTFNGIRGAAMLTALACGVLLLCQISEWIITVKKHISKDPATRGPRGAQIAGTFFGIFAIFWGFLATIIAVDFFDVRTWEYAYSFWLFLVSWLLILGSVIVTASNFTANGREVVGILGSFLAVVFYIISIGASQFVRSDTTGRLTVSRRTDTIGQFYVCSKETGQGDESCYFIEQDCVPESWATALVNCDQFNGIRATNVLALLFVGMEIVPFIVYSCLDEKNKIGRQWTAGTAIAFGWISAAFGMISMALALDYFDTHPTSYFGFSFWLQVLAWITALLSANQYHYGTCTCGSEGCGACNANGCAKQGPQAQGSAGQQASSPSSGITERKS